MGLLQDRAITRWSAQKILNWSNVDAAAALANNAAILDEIEDSAEAEFELMVGLTYDDTLTLHRHPAMICFQVVAREYGGAGGKEARAVRVDWEKLAKHLRTRIGSEARILPKSTSVLTPSSEQIGTEIVRPDADLPRFDDLIPDQRGPRSPDRPC